MIVLDYADRRPLYEQIMEKFQELILKGILAKDDPMPSVRSLATELSINPNTIQRAYMTLEQTGWIYSLRGKGSFVAEMSGARSARRKDLRQRLAGLMAEAELVGVTMEEFLIAVREDWPDAKGGTAQ